MDLDELKDRYKSVPVWGRCVAALVLGLLPGLYIYSEQGDALDQELEAVQARVSAAENDLSTKMQDKAQIPKLEQTKAFTEDQLEKAKKSLPDSFDIDDLLQKVASIAREVGVVLNSFEPQSPIEQNQGEVRFVELPVGINIQGKFHQIAMYLDRIAHLETAIFVRNLQLSRKLDTGDNQRGDTRTVSTSPTGGSSHSDNVEARKNMMMVASYSMVLFRSITDGESLIPPDVGAPADVSLAPSRKGRQKL